MRIASFKPLLLLVGLAVLGLAACDIAGEKNVTWEPGDELAIAPTGDQVAGDLPNDRLAPGTAYFYVVGHNSAQSYTWSVSPEASSEVLQAEKFFRIEYDEPGTYTISVTTTIDGQEYTGTLPIDVEAPTAAGQVGRLSQFSALATVIGASEISIPDSSVTILAPSNEALRAEFDADESGTVEAEELPADSVLTSILETHVIPQTLTAEDITAGATFETVGGDEVTFQGSGEALTVVVMNDMGEIIAEAPATLTGLAVANGTVIELGGVLTPTSASVDFLDQTAVDSVTVASVYLAQGGFVAIHDSTLLDGVVLGSVIGVSAELEAGIHNNVQVALFQDVPGGVFTQDSLQTDQTLIAMPHRDTNGNGTYDFITSAGTMDGPYTRDGNAVVDPAAITVAEE